MAHPTDSSLSQATEPKHGINFTIAPACEEYNVPFAEYTRSSPSFASYGPDIKLAGATGSVVYHKDRVLLVQRAPTDSMPLQWESPGGACDDTDSSILESASRELYEETGLVATHFVRLLTTHVWPHRRVGQITKFVFEIEVEKSGPDVPQVTLDPNEHCDFVWATQEEVQRGRSGDIELVFTNHTVKQYVLDGFTT